MSVGPLRVACIGAFGHSGDIFGELRKEGIAYDLIGWAPAYDGEPSERILGGPTFTGVTTFADYPTLLRESPEWVVVGTRLDHIARVSSDCLRAGAHVIAEKPLALCLDDLVSLHEVWRSSERHLAAMLTMENHPAFRAARAAIKEGRIGRVILAESRKSYRWGTRPDWFGDPAKYGGTFPWIGIHALNIVQFVSGLSFTGGSSRQANLAHPSHPGCEDVCVASLTADNGALVSISIDLARPQTAPTYGDDWCRVVGTEGVIEANSSEGWCRLVRDGLMELELPDPGARFAATIEAVRGGLSRDEQTARAFHLTEASLLARDAGESPFALRPDRWKK